MAYRRGMNTTELNTSGEGVLFCCSLELYSWRVGGNCYKHRISQKCKIGTVFSGRL